MHGRTEHHTKSKKERRKEERKNARRGDGGRVDRTHERRTRGVRQRVRTPPTCGRSRVHNLETQFHTDGLCFCGAHPVCLWISLKLARGSKDPQPTHHPLRTLGSPCFLAAFGGFSSCTPHASMRASPPKSALSGLRLSKPPSALPSRRCVLTTRSSQLYSKGVGVLVL